MCIGNDAIGYLLVFFRKDKKLNRLTGTIHYQIEHIADDNQGYEPEYHSSPVVEYEITG